MNYDELVTWQPTFGGAWDDTPMPKLSKKERKRAKKAAKQAAKQARAEAQHRLAESRQVRLEGHDGKLRVIFCDFDGVLNQHSSGNYNLLREQTELLDRLARATGAVLVVSSWWRWIGVEALRRDLASAGFHGRLIGRTPWLGENEQWDAWERGTEIQAVLDYLGDRVESFVILDDHDRMGDLLPYLVQTESTVGLTEADAARALDILLPRPVATLRQVYPNPLTPRHASTYTTCSA